MFCLNVFNVELLQMVNFFFFQLNQKFDWFANYEESFRISAEDKGKTFPHFKHCMLLFCYRKDLHMTETSQ